jgi:hypothetical protein
MGVVFVAVLAGLFTCGMAGDDELQARPLLVPSFALPSASDLDLRRRMDADREPRATASQAADAPVRFRMTSEEANENNRLARVFATEVMPRFEACMGPLDPDRRVELRSTFTRDQRGQRWVTAATDEAVELVDSDLAEELDDAATQCLAGALVGVSFPIEGPSVAYGQNYHVFWTYLAPKEKHQP